MEDIIRIGTVSSVDLKNGMVSVLYQDRDGKVTQPLPLFSPGGEYNMPDIGAKVLVAHLSNGGEMGVVLGTFWNEENAPGTSETYRKVIAPGVAVKYDIRTGNLVVTAPHIIFRAEDDSAEVSVADLAERT